MSYADFVFQKLTRVPPTGIEDALSVDLPDGLFDFQECIVRWALGRGRAAIFADTGLGKSRMQLSWAHAVHAATGHDVLILAPLAVAAQTVEEGQAIGVTVKQCKDGAEVEPGITITNYDRLHRFDTSRFGGVVLDESSVIKHHTSKTLQILLEAFEQTPFKLCATATPAPNDWTELGTHAQFLGVCTQVEMLSEYFVHDGGETQTWRLKGHAREQFWRWVASWAALVRSPSDLGFDGARYNLPPLRVHQHTTATDAEPDAGMLFALEANTLSERRKARKDTLHARVDACAAIVKSEWDKLAETAEGGPHALETGVREESSPESESRSGVRGKAKRAGSDGQGCAEGVHAGVLQVEPRQAQENATAKRGKECGEAGGRVPRESWLIWCDLNAEQDALDRHFGDLAFSVRGSMSPDEKESAILGWLRGERPVMISKPSIMGWGINAQHCARMAFVGVTDSWESYYQAVRRCWRFGQRREVEVHIFASDLEGAVVANLQRKETDALAMAEALSAETRGAVMEAVTGSTRMTNTYLPKRKAALPAWIKTEEAA